VSFILAVAGAITQIMLSFYGFWLAWRVLLPYLPAPRDPDDRVAPFVGYFTDPFINPAADDCTCRHACCPPSPSSWLPAHLSSLVG